MNICNLPEDERHQIHLMRRASLLIHDMKIGKINRTDITKEIDKLSECDREAFKGYLNMYKGTG